MIAQKSFFCSWSGGKDSTLAFFKAVQEGGKPQKLLTMFEENKERSRSHALPLDVLKAQADSIQVPLLIKGASWQTYEHEFLEALDELKKENVLIRYFNKPGIDNYLRITIGTEMQMEQLVKYLRKVIKRD